MVERYTNLNRQVCMKDSMIVTAVFSLLIMLTACSLNETSDENSYYYSVSVGSTIVLHQPVLISAEQVASYVQNGKLMSYDEVDKYRPNCKFEIYTMSEQSRTVEPDSFEIIRVVDEIESSSISKPAQLALHGDALMLSLLDRGNVFNYATMMYLKSDNQPDVYRMTCQHWEDIRDDRHLTIAQMRQAMGEVFTLEIKQ